MSGRPTRCCLLALAAVLAFFEPNGMPPRPPRLGPQELDGRTTPARRQPRWEMQVLRVRPAPLWRLIPGAAPLARARFRRPVVRRTPPPRPPRVAAPGSARRLASATAVTCTERTRHRHQTGAGHIGVWCTQLTRARAPRASSAHPSARAWPAMPAPTPDPPEPPPLRGGSERAACPTAVALRHYSAARRSRAGGTPRRAAPRTPRTSTDAACAPYWRPRPGAGTPRPPRMQDAASRMRRAFIATSGPGARYWLFNTCEIAFHTALNGLSGLFLFFRITHGLSGGRRQ